MAANILVELIFSSVDPSVEATTPSACAVSLAICRFRASAEDMARGCWHGKLERVVLGWRKAAWMAYLDMYFLDVDASLFDATLLSAVALFSHLNIPFVSLNDYRQIVLVSELFGC
ncbi:hypothetical protein FXO38_25825 [Capsicum annuum]|uniref:Uncharacterized protein n=1 Tax=Capsicum annuum TaxID=4072 RepID=A0A2G2ZNZ4_CAPAN|nr:hypothetical protein FXO37_27743 [Capsicum annuum]KAF3632989.1 hypothetical protein FXO38_25825 [Capsicum annuum]PHT83671.1 hypothetical protein T459_12114 [Capsicum annuum]